MKMLTVPPADPEVFQRILKQLVEELTPDRAMVLLWKPEDHDGEPLAVHGMECELPSLINVNVSTTLLARAYVGRSCLERDLRNNPGYGTRFSEVASGARSVLCVRLENYPILLYADRQVANHHPFQAHHSAKALDLAQALERSLDGEEAPAFKPAPLVKAAPPPARPKPSPPVLGRPRATSMAPFFRSFATMFSAGIHITHSLEVLAHHGDDKALPGICRHMLKTLEEGGSLAYAMQSIPGSVFPPATWRLVAAGETSGSLERVLNQLADHYEMSRRLQYRLVTSLSYPAMALLAGLGLLLSAPWLLKSHLQMLAGSGLALPWPTRVVLLLNHPLTWVAFAGVVGGGTWWLRRNWGQLAFYRRLTRLPGLGRVLTLGASARFCYTLAMLVDAGVSLPAALKLAVESTDSPILQHRLAEAQEALLGGGGAEGILTGCLRTLELPGALIGAVAAMEEAGRLPETLKWLAQRYEEDLGMALETYAALAEPLVMLGLGTVVAFLLLALFLPMMQLVQSL